MWNSSVTQPEKYQNTLLAMIDNRETSFQISIFYALIFRFLPKHDLDLMRNDRLLVLVVVYLYLMDVNIVSAAW